VSIYSSWPGIGQDEDTDAFDGTVRAYLGSHHYPLDGEPDAAVHVATIVPWCVPGHRETRVEEIDGVAPWLRLALHTPDDDGTGNRSMSNPRTVALSEVAARALAAQLIEWADTPKVHPREWEPSGLDEFAKPCHYRRCVLPVWHVGAHEVREVEG
jgi:hypothetical protein